MHRSSSTTRASEEFFIHNSSTTDTDELPMYDPLSDFAKKERLRVKYAENAVHLIPLILVLCAVILWFFSNPEMDMANKDGSIMARIEGLTIDGDMEVTGSETGLLSSLELEGGLAAPKEMADQNKAERFSEN